MASRLAWISSKGAEANDVIMEAGRMYREVARDCRMDGTSGCLHAMRVSHPYSPLKKRLLDQPTNSQSSKAPTLQSQHAMIAYGQGTPIKVLALKCTQV